jgi:hypothetical protein
VRGSGNHIGNSLLAGLRQVQQQLREIVLQVNVVPAAGAGQACQDRRRPPAARVAHE